MWWLEITAQIMKGIEHILQVIFRPDVACNLLDSRKLDIVMSRLA